MVLDNNYIILVGFFKFFSGLHLYTTNIDQLIMTLTYH